MAVLIPLLLPRTALILGALVTMALVSYVAGYGWCVHIPSTDDTALSQPAFCGFQVMLSGSRNEHVSRYQVRAQVALALCLGSLRCRPHGTARAPDGCQGSHHQQQMSCAYAA